MFRIKLVCIRPKDIRENADIPAPCITKLVETCFETGEIPVDLKKSVVRPIYKNGRKSDYQNHRPISVLPVLEKILEEVLVNRLNSFIKKFNVIDDRQYGFQKGKNVNQLLGKFSNHLNDSLSRNKHCLVLFLDFSKAFDTLPHEKLLQTLFNIGIRGHSLNLFKDYLSNRSFSVKVNNSFSNDQNSIYGVPQGSKLGPLLFLIYSNNLIKNIKNGKVFAYADDTAIVIDHEDFRTAVELMQNELHSVSKWCHDFGLIVNAKKTKIMYVRPVLFPSLPINLYFKNFCPSAASAANVPIEIVQTYKYLGITVDDHLKWHCHVSQVIQKLRRTSYALHHLRYCSNSNILNLVYSSLAESYIRYGIAAWGSSTHCTQLQKSQNRLLKILTKSGSKKSFLSIENIYKMTLINEFYNEREYRRAIDHEHFTRLKSQGKYKTAKFWNLYSINTLNCTLPRLLNELPIELLKVNDVFKRKRLLKAHFLERQQDQRGT